MRAGPFVYVSGQVPRDATTGALLGETVGEQATATLDNLAEVLRAAEATLADVVSVTVYLADANDWDAFNVVYRKRFAAPYPARTVVGASLRGIQVELSAVAYRP